MERISALNGSRKTEYLYDGRGSVAAELTYSSAWYNLSGALSKTNVTGKTYSPFGEQLSGKLSGFGYNAELYDSATGSIYLRARNYEPAMNRFSQKDILRGAVTEPTSLNRYLYVQNDPMNFVDANGQFLKSAWNAVKSGVSKFVNAVKSVPLPKPAAVAPAKKASTPTQPTTNRATTASRTPYNPTPNRQDYIQQQRAATTPTPQEYQRLLAAGSNLSYTEYANQKHASGQSYGEYTNNKVNNRPDYTNYGGVTVVQQQQSAYYSNSGNTTATFVMSNDLYYCSGREYDRDAVRKYVEAYNKDPNSKYIYFNDSWSFIISYFLKYGVNPGRGDCANYVSQCLLAGGMSQNEQWYYNTSSETPDFSSSWVNPNELYSYIINSEYARDDMAISGSLEDVHSELLKVSSKIQTGDLLFWDSDGNGTMDHATIIDGVFTKGEETEKTVDFLGEPTYSGHTESRIDNPVGAGYGQYENQGILHIVRING